MSDDRELRLSLAVLISFFLHAVIFASLIAPHLDRVMELLRAGGNALSNSPVSRDIIANMNQDDLRVRSPHTLLSDRDSSARGHITKKPGDRWLNNSLDFQYLRGDGRSGSGNRGKTAVDKKITILLSRDPEATTLLEKSVPRRESGGSTGAIDRVLVPDKNDITMENALYYSNDGHFSFNTEKFKNFAYFKRMKDKIASHWYPPQMANAVIYGYNPLTGGYAPGRTRIMAIPGQEVRLYFVMDRRGDIREVNIVESMGNQSLDSSCLDAVKLSKSFGAVPDDIKGEFVVIPFIFGYYIY